MVPGCPEPTANQALVDAAIAFCEDTLVLREDLATFSTVAGTSTYTLAAPSADYAVQRILHVAVDGWPVEVVPYERIGTPQALSGVPRVAYMTRGAGSVILNLYPTPDAVLPVVVNTALRPVRGATQLDDLLFDVWPDAIVYGAVSRILAIQNQPFSDPSGSMSAMTLATRLANRARIDGSYGRARGQIAVTARPFA